MAHGVHPQLHLQFGAGDPEVLNYCTIMLVWYNIVTIITSRSANWNQLVTYSEPAGHLKRCPFYLQNPASSCLWGSFYPGVLAFLVSW